MNLQELYERLNCLTEYAHRKGCTHIRYYIDQSQDFRINIYRQELDQYSLSETCQIFMEAEVNGFRGTTYLENPDESTFEELVGHVIATAEANRQPYDLKPFESNSSSAVEPLPAIDPAQAIAMMKEADQYAYQLDNRIDNVSFCLLNQSQRTITLLDESGAQLTDRTGWICCEIDVVAKETKDGVSAVQTAYSDQFSRSFSQLDPKRLAQEAVTQAVSLLHSQSLPSGSYPVILQNRAAGQILAAFLPVFSAEAIQRSMSLLKGKTGQTIASPIFSFVEDPASPSGMITRSFDDEGTPTSKKYLIRDGVFETVLYNQRTGEKDGVPSTGNGFKRSYRENSSTLVTNLSIVSGSASYDELVSRMGDGVVITGVDGLHAGVQPASGTFSLIAQGFLVEGGKITRPLSQITVGGSLLGMLQGIEAIGSDVETTRNDKEFLYTPSLLINHLAISGC